MGWVMKLSDKVKGYGPSSGSPCEISCKHKACYYFVKRACFWGFQSWSEVRSEDTHGRPAVFWDVLQKNTPFFPWLV